MFATLKTLVLKTATVAGVKLVTPADRIGLGFDLAAYPTDNLSPNPVPEHVGSWRELSEEGMQMQPPTGGDAVQPTGCPSAPGVSASRSGSLTASFTSGRTTRTTATGRTREGLFVAGLSRANVPGDHRPTDRLGRDCQSLRRLSDKRVAIRGVVSAATAGK